MTLDPDCLMEPLLYTYWLCFLEQVNQPLISLLICKMGETATPNSRRTDCED